MPSFSEALSCYWLDTVVTLKPKLMTPSLLNGSNSSSNTTRDIPTLILKLTESKSLLKTLKLSTKTPLVPSVLPNSSIYLLLNSLKLTWTSRLRFLKKLPHSMMNPMTSMLTGLPLVRLLESRTNNNVVHAGLSPPLVLLNLLLSLLDLLITLSIYPNNN